MKSHSRLYACILLGIILSWPGLLRGQSLITLPHHHLKITDTPGTVIWTRITNTTKHSITLHPLLSAGRAVDSATFIKNIMAQIRLSKDTDFVRLQLIDIVGRHMKSPDKTNMLSVFKGMEDSIICRKYSLTGSQLSIPGWQCEDFCKEAAFILYATGYFRESDFLLCSSEIHTVLQVKLQCGDTVFADMTAAKPVLMVANPEKKPRWASLSDIMNDQTLINSSGKYYYRDKEGNVLDLSVQSMEGYNRTFNKPFKQRVFYVNRYRLDNFTGDFILSPGQVIEYRDTAGYLIDTGSNGKGEMVRQALEAGEESLVQAKSQKTISAMAQGMMNYYALYAHLLDTSIQAAIILCSNREVQFYNNSAGWYPGHTTRIPVLHSYIPEGDDTLYYGVQTSAPLLITGSYEFHLKDTVVYKTDFYAPGIYSPPPVVGPEQVNYANGIGRFKYILPHTRLVQDLLYNYNVLNFYTGGPMFTASGPGIVVSSSADAGKQDRLFRKE